MVLYRYNSVAVILVVLMVYVDASYAQGDDNSIISGQITDEETGTPLAGVHVFLSSRLQGTTTDSDGNYELVGLEPGTYKVVASIIGYEPASQELQLEHGKRVVLNIPLRVAIYELENLEVADEVPREWEKELKRFTQLFLGESGNGRKSEIINPFVLSFEEKNGVFYATASEPLRIRNNNLGYRLTFVLNQFVYDGVNDRSSTDGSWYFEELEPSGEDERQAWAVQREITFKGSLQHLLWALINDRAEEEGFSVLRDYSEGREVPELFLHRYHPLNASDVIAETPQPYEYQMQFSDFIRVHYIRTGDKRKLFSRATLPAEQLSYLKSTGEPVVLHRTGYMTGADMLNGKILVFGYLATLGVADLLPQEYALLRDADI